MKPSPRTSDPFWALVATARRLQGPGGCPWDRAQTVNSLLPHLVEETWEVFEAVRSRHRRDVQEELGDVLYTVLFLALIAERKRQCRLTDLLTATRKKMVRRHPHVFGDKHAQTPNAAYQAWQDSKRREGRKRHSPTKAFRERLVAWWEWLRTHPEGELHTALSTGDTGVTRRRRATGSSRRPSATRGRGRGRL